MPLAEEPKERVDVGGGDKLGVPVVEAATVAVGTGVVEAEAPGLRLALTADVPDGSVLPAGLLVRDGKDVGVGAPQAPATEHNGVLQTCSVRRMSAGGGLVERRAEIEAALSEPLGP